MTRPISAPCTDEHPPLRLDASGPVPAVYSGHLKLGGRDPHGNTIGLTNYYVELNGEPVLPVMGEFHFSRFPREQWSEELHKMKAGGIDIVATYVFWIHHEEDAGVFCWTGDRDLRAFVEACAHARLSAIVRIGPFCHGECRNGGLPDWLYGRPFPVRSTDPRFLCYVRRLYGEIGNQLDGLLFKDGGPVIGVQLDNEYVHAGAPWEVTARQGTEWVPSGHEGASYMRALKDAAIEAGLNVPLYTCTAWLRSPVIEHELLPTQVGYAFMPWVPDPEYRQPPSREFIFRDRHARPLLDGSPDYAPASYPYVTSELGGGTQITYYHRPILPPACPEAMAVVALGSGTNLLGYYMFHGGSNPVGRHSFMNEFTVPRISYDFQAPIREFGQIAESYRALRLIHLFLHAFGSILAPMRVFVPEGAEAVAPDDTSSVRWAARVKDGAAFLFLTNYQDHVERHDQRDIRLSVGLGAETVVLPRAGGLILSRDTSAILPLNLLLGTILLVYATAQPVTVLAMPDMRVYVFFAPAGMTSEYAFDRATYAELAAGDGCVVEHASRTYVGVEPGTGSAITLRTVEGEMIQILTLTRLQALQCTKLYLWGRERLLLSTATARVLGDHIRLTTTEPDVSISLFPALAHALRTAEGPAEEAEDGLFRRYTRSLSPRTIPLELTPTAPGWWNLRCPIELLAGGSEHLLRVNYVGDIAEAYIDGSLVADNFWNGTNWEIGIRRFADRLAQHELVLHVTPPRRGSDEVRYRADGMGVHVDSAGEAMPGIVAISAVPVYELDAWPGADKT